MIGRFDGTDMSPTLPPRRPREGGDPACSLRCSSTAQVSGPSAFAGATVFRIAGAFFGALVFALVIPASALAQTAAPSAIPGALDRAFGSMGGTGGQGMTLSLQLLMIMGLLTILPSLILMMTSFTRILIVLSILRQALGLQQSPPNQVLIGLSLFLSLFIMAPTLEAVSNRAIQPYSAGTINAEVAIQNAGQEFHHFMIARPDSAIWACSPRWPTRPSSRTPTTCRSRSCCPRS